MKEEEEEEEKKMQEKHKKRKVVEGGGRESVSQNGERGGSCLSTTRGQICATFRKFSLTVLLLAARCSNSTYIDIY